MENTNRGRELPGAAGLHAGLFGRAAGILMVFLAAFFLAAEAGAETAKTAAKNDQACADSAEPERMLAADRLSVTEHTLQAADFKLSYQATAGTLPVKAGQDGAECRIFFIGYHAKNREQSPRPLTFVFNGGPGASSAYLHMGVLGPKRVMLHEDGTMPAPPARLEDNMLTWLRFTDLVFVDPAGTGYSRCGSQEEKDGKRADAMAWGVREDLTALAEFIRLYLTRYDRWLSPKFLVGESYGGFRVAALSDFLQTDKDIALNGIVLVSPALEFELVHGNEFSLLPWVARLPSYAASARKFGKAAGPAFDAGNPRKSMEEVEHFAIREYLPALAAADTGSVLDRLAAFIGLPVSRVAQFEGRIAPHLFSKELLRGAGRLVSIYDGSVSGIDPDPTSPFPRGKDFLLVQFNTLLAAGFNSYIREQLHFETDIPYEILNEEVASRWNWRSGLGGVQGFAGVAENLRNSMSVNQELRVLIAHGMYDLITPYYGSVLVTGQMALDPSVASNLSLNLYDGGHMFYTNDKARKQFFKDAEHFYASAASTAAEK